MNLKPALLLILFSIAFVACEKEKTQLPEGSESLKGAWINPQYTETSVTYQRSGDLIDNEYGFLFSSQNKFLERKNSGWCGTPPISYADFEGTWAQNDSIISISVEFWGGVVDYKWKIISIGENQLTIVELENVYHGLD